MLRKNVAKVNNNKNINKKNIEKRIGAESISHNDSVVHF